MGTIAMEALEGKLAKKTFFTQREGLTLTTAGLGGGDLAEAQADAELNSFRMTTADTFYWWVDPVGDLWNFDLARDIWAAVLYESAGGAADAGIVWKVGIKGVAEGIVLTDGAVSADGSKTFDAETVTATSGVERAGPGHLNMPNTLVNDELAMLWCELDDDGDAAGDEIGLIAVRLYGTLNFCSSSGQVEQT
jgi:hypothetical protein